MSCDQVREWISADLDGEATPDERRAADQHLAGCSACRAWRDRAERISRLVRAEADPVDLGDPTADVDGIIAAATRAFAPVDSSALPSWIPRRSLPDPAPVAGTPRPGCHCGPDCPCVTGRPGLCACGTSCTCGVA